MSETMQLLRLFRVEKQLRGLKSRLTTAQKFLQQQRAQLNELDSKRASLEGQLRQLKVAMADDEGEAARLDARIATLREQMNQAKTAKEYNALLTELNTYKQAKSEVEDTELEEMSKSETLQAEVEQVTAQHAERAKMVENAERDCREREAEIKDRVDELTTQRDQLAQGIPASARDLLSELIDRLGDDAMSPVEVLDRRNHEYSCGSCMMAIPIESVNAVLSGRLTQCVSCHCILYTEEDLLASGKKGRKQTVAET